MSSTTNQKLVINLNEDYKIKIELGKDFDKSIFSEVYQAALDNVKEIINQSENHNSYYSLNNIIAFTGERGKGKSSSMISFRDALIEKETNNHKDFFWTVEKGYLFSDIKFASIDIIDPSLFTGGESLFEIILAKMFQKFQSEIKKPNCIINQDDRRAIIQNFQDVFENLQIINSDRKDLYRKESIEVLSKLAASSNLRETFNDLIKLYLKKFEDGKDFLVIAIDDFDLNVSGVYDMLEDIRQYLIQSKIILLVACKIEQLKETVDLYYKNLKIEFETDKKSKKYVDKIIPFNRRLFLPDVRKLTNKEFKIIEDDKIVFESNDNNFKISILKLVYEKVNLFLSLDVLKQNAIIPETIRETQNFVNTLFHENNVNKLKSYILEESNYNDKLHDLLNELEEIPDDLFLLILSKKLINLYPTKSKMGEIMFDKIFSSSKSRYLKRVSNTIIAGRVSIGDINFLLREYENEILIDDYSLFKFLSYLKTYISLRIITVRQMDDSFVKYGFINEFLDILPRESGRFSRDIFDFSKTQISDLNSLADTEKLFFAMWAAYLGEGYQEYKQAINKDIFVESYVNGGLSPCALLHNIYNIKDLSGYFNFEIDSDLAIKLQLWFVESSFVKQLANPFFNLKLIEYIKFFRNIEVKEALPDNYFDTICLLFIYGIVYSLDRIEEEYNINGLVEDFLSNPIYLEMIQIINNKEYSFRVVGDLNKKYPCLIYNKELPRNLSDKVIDLVNNIYLESKSEKIRVTETSSVTLSYETINILSDLRWNLENRNVTSRVITNRVGKLAEIAGTEKIIEFLNAIKYNLNSENTYEQAKNDLIIYINELING